jgi:uncharacterized protein (UPF0333 family)
MRTLKAPLWFKPVLGMNAEHRAQRAQTSMEYLLIAAAVVMIIAITVLLVRNNVIAPENSAVNKGIGNYTNLLNGFNATPPS